MIWKFMERNQIKLDTKSLLLYRFSLSNERTIAALKMLSRTVLTSDFIISNCILAKALEVDDTSLVELIFKRYGSNINVPQALYNACAIGAVLIVKWIFSNFPHREFNIETALMLSCSNGGIEHMTFQYGCLSDTGDVALYLLNNFRTKTNKLDLAMQIGLKRSSFNACKILMENTDNYFHADAVLKGIARIKSDDYTRSNKCFAFVQYLVTKYSCLNVDVLLQIAEHLKKNFDMVRWIMSRTDNKIFYTAWKTHQWIHKEICALQLIYDTEFYKTLDLTGLIQEELTYGNNNCIRFLMEKVNVEKAEKIIVNRVCSSGDENLMQIMFEKFISLNIADTMKIALKHSNWEAVKWLCKNFDDEKLNVQAFMKEAINCGEISVIRYFTEIFDRKYFDSNAILVAIGRGASFTCMEIDDLTCLIKWYLQDIKNRYRINDVLKLSCMKEKKYTQELFKVVFQNNKSEFLHLNIALTTLLTSRDFESLKILLCNYDTAIFDMHLLIERIWDISKDRTYADDITKWLLQHFDQISFDIPYILKKACLDDKLEFVQWMCGHYSFSNLTFESIFIYACKYSAISVIQWMFEKIALIPLRIDLKKVIKEVIVLKMSVVIFFIQNFELDRSDIDNICKLYSEDEIDQLEFQLCIFEAYGSDMVDVKTVFDSVCRLSSVQEVKWFMNIVDSDLDVISGMKEALCGNNNETFQFLYESLNVIDPKEADLIFMKASYHGNLRYVQLFHKKYGESLSISAAIKELCQNTSKTNKHFDVFKFLVSFSSPSIINCQSLLNQACYSGDIENITWLLDNFDPDLFEVRSAIHYAFDKFLSTDHKRRCEDITMLLLHRCQCTLSDIQAVMETVCSKGMVTLMKWLVLIFGPDSFDFRRILDIAISPINTEIFPLAFCQCRNSQIDLQNIIISACKTGGNETLMIYIFFTVMVGLDQHLVVDTIYTILDIRSIHSTDITNEVIKFLFMKVDSNTVDFTSILKRAIRTDEML
ncbi:unnamed protein product [Mytilus edulis]|uniref:Uncharacterized protein n=1 Tax=Mytilus edulis TaxID=6550 RepID=A0A8S3SB02_MYTED|nr:unnamed protein product [Mytilus edulis]